MSKFFRIRHSVPITYGGVSHLYFAREMGYEEFNELKEKVLAAETNGEKERKGFALMKATVLACIEEEDGTPSYQSEEEYRVELKPIILELGKAAMKAQGYVFDRTEEDTSETERPTEEEIAGNDLPSRTSGESSPLTSAAPSES